MEIEVRDETGHVSDAQLALVRELLERAAERLGQLDRAVLVTFVSQEKIRQLNQTYRGIDAPTDVISLEYQQEEISCPTSLSPSDWSQVIAEFNQYLGELYLSVEQAVEQSRAYGHSLDREIGFLVVHGFLHLNGYDHIKEEEEKEMVDLQEEILQSYGLTR